MDRPTSWMVSQLTARRASSGCDARLDTNQPSATWLASTCQLLNVVSAPHRPVVRPTDRECDLQTPLERPNCAPFKLPSQHVRMRTKPSNECRTRYVWVEFIVSWGTYPRGVSESRIAKKFVTGIFRDEIESVAQESTSHTERDDARNCH